jgi:glutamyl-tRNA reductase
VSQASPSTVVALIAHARQVPALERERFGTRLREEAAGPALLLETCHRVEVYFMSPDHTDSINVAGSLPAGGEALIGERAVRHAITVAVGRDSVVVGEDQILHQLRKAVDRARADDALDPALERLFALALQAGRRARSWRQDPPRSLADLAIASIERQAGSLRDGEWRTHGEVRPGPPGCDVRGRHRRAGRTVADR